MEDNDIFHLFYHILDTKHPICQVSIKSNKAKLSKYKMSSAVRTTLLQPFFKISSRLA